MRTVSSGPGVVAFALLAGAIMTSHAAAGNGTFDLLGVTALIERLGDDTPSGAGVVAAEVEVPEGNGSYGPNQGSPQYNGKTFTAMSGDPGDAFHAHTVGRYQFGNFWSMAHGVTEIYLYSATGWMQSDFLRVGAGGTTPPLPMPGDIKVLNHSWVGSFGSTVADNDALRRLDLVVNRNQVIMTVGVNNNGGESFPLLSHVYNGISVGIRQGIHVGDATGSGYDGPGRMKPEIVGVEGFTSFATPQVNAAASVLTETARTWPGLAENPNAERSEVLKASLMAGAVHENLASGSWSNQPDVAGPDRGLTSTPIDAMVGAGTVNIDRSHRILTGGEQDAMDVVPTASTISYAGWDFATVGQDASAFWRFNVMRPASAISILATWNRTVRLGNNTWEVADFDLTLWRIDETGTPTSLLGDTGLDVFSGGNVVSMSGVDNVEHLYLMDLAPGQYVIELTRQDDLATADWAAAVAWLMPETTLPPEDIDGDGVVGFLDLLAVLSAWGDCVGCPEDIDGDGIVGFLDLLAVLSAWT